MAASSADGQPAFDLPHRPRVLVVEDESLIAFSLEQRLRKGGAIIVGPFASGSEARAALNGDAPVDAAILDIKLNDGDVYRSPTI
jgi:CheY-like chemotaxis protein